MMKQQRLVTSSIQSGMMPSTIAVTQPSSYQVLIDCNQPGNSERLRLWAYLWPASWQRMCRMYVVKHLYLCSKF